MIERLSPWNLGATLYMPATRLDIASIILNQKIVRLRSLVICLEDAVSDIDVPFALENLKNLVNILAEHKKQSKHLHLPLLFIRPRHTNMAKWMTLHLDLSAIDGFVLPKFTQASLPTWWSIIENTHLSMMPTLETAEVFDVIQMTTLAEALLKHPCRAKIIALRIGGNDLMNVLSLRRTRHLTLYDGPMGYVIKMLVAVFGTRQFALTAPVCEHIDDNQMMEKELELDIANGLVGKTAIHPKQIYQIEQALMVSQAEHSDALRILNSTQAVFKSQGAMCEPATHRHWALTILTRAKLYGINPNQQKQCITR
ncbi:HpcH/HpaI aldolase/citrate lyase family protein [Proteus myxofaciens]|uniref:Citrate lyase subunit beta n=1 Tax=Proteus myxofaciens ATCC 19692 TaxID=1354337 RepID=A0A198G807_9GAMM|nr:HpcH/HpaI aldolase/citrate lyase family protein [Proteus myxofaciens]OAT33233.1 citrate lyase subunit beta [Proteus myxofaciens ATCC 19692]